MARLAHPRQLGGSMLATWHNARNLDFGRAPVTNLNQPISRQRTFAGSELISLFPVVPLTGNLRLGVPLLSYAGQLNIAAVADGRACPDVEACIQGLRRTLREIGIPTTEGIA